MINIKVTLTECRTVLEELTRVIDTEQSGVDYDIIRNCLESNDIVLPQNFVRLVLEIVFLKPRNM